MGNKVDIWEEILKPILVFLLTAFLLMLAWNNVAPKEFHASYDKVVSAYLLFKAFTAEFKKRR